MTVETFDPHIDPHRNDPHRNDPHRKATSESGFSLTPAALNHARRQLQLHGHRGIRLAVKQSGCSGYMYALQFVDEPTTNDDAFKVADDLTLYVDRAALPLVDGTQIDYVTEGLNSQLKFKNPNATAECGCGESFAVD